MHSQSKLKVKPAGRRRSGSNAVEFTYCLVFIFFIILLPLANYGTFITRWAISSQIVSAWTQNMAKKRKLSDAFKSYYSDKFAMEVSNPTGVRVTAVNPALIIAKVKDPTQSLRVEQPGKIPPHWQPDRGSFNYSLNVVVNTRIDPLVSVQFFGLKVPGLTEPAEVVMTGNALWENMGRDPITTEYYVNE